MCSDFIIAQFSAFVNNMSANLPKKVLDKMQAVWYNDRKSTPSNVLTAAPVVWLFVEITAQSECRAVISFFHHDQKYVLLPLS